MTVRGQTFYAASQNPDGEWVSTDDGRSWRPRTRDAVVIGSTVSQRVTARVGFRMVPTANGAERFQRTDDAGRHWETLHPVLVGR